MTLARAAQWSALRDELARWACDDTVARLWLRDDDAVTVTPALERPQAVCCSRVPYPDCGRPERCRSNSGGIPFRSATGRVAAHGWRHHNHATIRNGISCRTALRGHRSRFEQARARIETLFGEKAVPIFVPPWNRMAPRRRLSCLDQVFARYRRLVERNRRACANNQRPPDIIDWRGSRGGRNPADLISELRIISPGHGRTTGPLSVS